MAQRVRTPHRGQCPSSVTQLPILTALHARFPTLFSHIIHHQAKKVNPQFTKIGDIFCVYQKSYHRAGAHWRENSPGHPNFSLKIRVFSSFQGITSPVTSVAYFAMTLGYFSHFMIAGKTAENTM